MMRDINAHRNKWEEHGTPTPQTSKEQTGPSLFLDINTQLPPPAPRNAPSALIAASAPRSPICP